MCDCKNTTIEEKEINTFLTRIIVYCCDCGKVVSTEVVSNKDAVKEYDKDI